MNVVVRSYRYRIYPTVRQAEALETQLRACCNLYNAALEQRIRAWREHGVSLSRYDQYGELTQVRAAGLMPNEMSLKAQRSALDRLDEAFQAFFRRCGAGQTPGYPRFRSPSRYDSLSWARDDGAGVRDGRLRVMGVGAVRVRWHRPIPDDAKIRTVTVKRQNGRWWMVLALRLCEPAALPPTGRSVGIDRGVAVPYALSTGEHVEGPRAQRKGAAGVRLSQRRAARKERGSARQRRAYGLVARRKEREANRRRDFLHKLSRRLVKENDLVAFEDLGIARMVRGGNRGLNREIADQGWATLAWMTAYKAEEAGRRVVKVPAYYTSQRCHACGAVDAASRRGGAFRCTSCGMADHSDTNAAKNILSAGLALQALTQGEGVCVA